MQTQSDIPGQTAHLALDVAVREVLAVNAHQRHQHLTKHTPSLGRIGWRSALKPVAQGAPLEELHLQVHAAAIFEGRGVANDVPAPCDAHHGDT